MGARISLLTAALVCLPAGAAQGAAVGWGRNDGGQLGAGFINRFEPRPVSVSLPGDVVQMASGRGFTLALRADGTVLAWGDNTFGGLGSGNHTRATRPQPVPGLTGVRQVAAGGQHAIALLSGGIADIWGGDLYGNGNGESAEGNERKIHPLLSPTPLKGVTGIEAVAAGGANDAAILADGRVLVWGEDTAGQLCQGSPHANDAATPVAAKGIAGAVEVVFGGEPSLGGHLLARMPSGAVVGCGQNLLGQLGDGTLLQRTLPVPVRLPVGATELAADADHNLALVHGVVYAWGEDAFGQLGRKVSTICGHVRKAPCAEAPVAALVGASQVATGFHYSLALAAGLVLGWGDNTFGQLGNGTLLSSPIPVPALVGHATAIAGGGAYAFATIAGEGPPPPLELTPGVGSLTVRWRAPERSEPWIVRWRAVTKPTSPFGKIVNLPSTARSYTVTGLTGGRQYTVLVASEGAGARSITGAPL